LLKHIVLFNDSLNESDLPTLTVRSPLAAKRESFYWTLWLDFAVPALQKRWQKNMESMELIPTQ